jgi:hypothetical protein
MSGGEDDGDGKAELGEPMLDGAVGVAAELTEVGQPAVVPLDRPAQAEWHDLLGLACLGALADLRADELDAEVGDEAPDDRVVVAAGRGAACGTP